MRAAEREPGVRILRSETVTADVELAGWMEIDTGEPLVLLEILRTGNNVPILLATHYVPADRFPDFSDRFRQIETITQTFASCDVVGYSRRATRISARPSSAIEARALAIPESFPVLGWVSVNVDRDGRPINLDASVFAASRIDIVFEES